MVAVASALAVVLGLALVPAHATAAPPAGARYGSRLEFLGWSPSSRYVAYTRTRHRPRRGQHAKPIDEVQRVHRQVLEGAFAGFGESAGGDVQGYAALHHYVVDPAPRERTSPTTTVFRAGDREYRLELAVGNKVGWVLSRGDTVLVRQTFDTIYLDFDAELFLAPDLTQAVLVMHLDAGWVVDAAIYPLRLVPAAKSTAVHTAPVPEHTGK